MRCEERSGAIIRATERRFPKGRDFELRFSDARGSDLRIPYTAAMRDAMFAGNRWRGKMKADEPGCYVHYLPTHGPNFWDSTAMKNDGNAALATFEAEFFAPARASRLQLLQQVAANELDVAELPKDVLMTLLSNQDNLSIPDETVLREIAYFPWVGSHSTSGAFVNLMDHIFEWIDSHPDSRNDLVDDIALIQRFGFESLRLHPASPESVRIAVSDTTIEPDFDVSEGSRVVIDMQAANRDPLIFGSDASQFNPYRDIPSDVSPWGLSFGSGFHACIGQELVSGLEQTATDTEVPLTGAIATMGPEVTRLKSGRMK